jgi:hypothetical protein|tara:strand:- start:64 stop:267 length:204 start_codon:yes stop_codon:yes gene_type:complete
MKANQLLEFLLKVEEMLKPYGRTLKDVDVNYRMSDDSDVEEIDWAGADLFDAETNQIIESIILMGKY